MKKQIHHFILLCCLVMPGVAFPSGTILQGKWLLTFDPDGPVAEDWMNFRENGSADLGDNKGVYLTCPYKVVAQTVILTCTVRGKQKKLVMKAEENFKKLRNTSGAIYTKQ